MIQKLNIYDGGLVLESKLDMGGLILTNRGDVFQQFDCHMKYRYFLDRIDDKHSGRVRYINREKRLVYEVKVYDLMEFMSKVVNKFRGDTTLVVDTNKGYIQWFCKPAAIMVDEWIKETILI